MAVLAMPEDTQVAVLEMGMNHFREIAYLSGIAHPDIAVIVNIGTTHMEFLGSQAGIRKAKMEIVEGMDAKGLLLLNGDDVQLRHLDKQPEQRITYFGRLDGNSVQGLDTVQDGEVLRFRVEAGKLSFPVEMHLREAWILLLKSSTSSSESNSGRQCPAWVCALLYLRF